MPFNFHIEYGIFWATQFLFGKAEHITLRFGRVLACACRCHCTRAGHVLHQSIASPNKTQARPSYASDVLGLIRPNTIVAFFYCKAVASVRQCSVCLH